MPQQSARNASGKTASDAPLSAPIGYCRDCDRTVFVGQILVADDLVNACVHCDAAVDEKSLRRVPIQELIDLGYVVDGVAGEVCDSHGGCNDGSCGVRQPDGPVSRSTFAQSQLGDSNAI